MISDTADCVVSTDSVVASLGIHHNGLTVVLPSSSVVVTVVSGSSAYVMVFSMVVEVTVDLELCDVVELVKINVFELEWRVCVLGFLDFAALDLELTEIPPCPSRDP